MFLRGEGGIRNLSVSKLQHFYNSLSSSYSATILTTILFDSPHHSKVSFSPVQTEIFNIPHTVFCYPTEAYLYKQKVSTLLWSVEYRNTAI